MKKKTMLLLDEVNIKTNNLLNELNSLSYLQLNHKKSNGKWSIAQILNHLIISESLSLRYCQKKLSFNPKLKKVGFATDLRMFFLKLYLFSPLKYKAPTIVGTGAIPAQDTLSNIRENWTKQREELDAFVKNLPEKYYEKELYRHPIVGRISTMDMLMFFLLHLNHHQNQIKKALRAL